MCMYVCVYTCLCVGMSVCRWICVCVRICASVRMPACAVRAYLYVCSLFMFVVSRLSASAYAPASASTFVSVTVTVSMSVPVLYMSMSVCLCAVCCVCSDHFDATQVSKQYQSWHSHVTRKGVMSRKCRKSCVTHMNMSTSHMLILSCE